MILPAIGSFVLGVGMFAGGVIALTCTDDGTRGDTRSDQRAFGLAGAVLMLAGTGLVMAAGALFVL